MTVRLPSERENLILKNKNSKREAFKVMPARAKYMRWNCMCLQPEWFKKKGNIKCFHGAMGVFAFKYADAVVINIWNSGNTYNFTLTAPDIDSPAKVWLFYVFFFFFNIQFGIDLWTRCAYFHACTLRGQRQRAGPPFLWRQLLKPESLKTSRL